MKILNGNVYWQNKSKIHKTYPYLSYDTNCDVLIIGGGISGALSAYSLAEEGANVILVEKNILGYGSTSASSALLDYQTDVDLYRLEKILGKNQARRVYNLCLSAIDKLEQIDEKLDESTGFRRQDTLYFTNKFMHKNFMAKECNIRKEAGFNTTFLDNHDIINLSSGILTKNSSGVINPYLFTQAICNFLSNLDNVRIFENTCIEDIKCSYDYVTCTTNNNFNIVADTVIFTSGFETLKYIQNVPVDIYKNFTIVSKPIEKLNDGNTNFIARDMSEPYHTIRFDNYNRIIYSGECIKMTDRLTDEKYLYNIANDKYRRLYNSLKKSMYDIDNPKIDYTYNVTFATTKDTLPIIDEIPNMPNCFCNLGFGSNGITYSQIGASMLKNAIKGFYTKDMNMFSISRENR